MSFVTKDLLINFLFTLLALFLVQMFYLIKYAKKIHWWKDRYIALFPILAITFCLLFPVNGAYVPDDYRMDLRRIPYILGTLYGGWPLGSLLFVFILLLRLLIGGYDVGFLSTLIALPILSIPLFFITKYFLHFSLKNRIIVSTCLSIVGSLLAMLVSIFVLHVTSIPISVWVQFAILDVAGMFVITILWEAIRANLLVLQRLMKAEKLEIVSHLAASISHEVRNPLTASRGFMQMLQEDEKEPAKKRYISIAINELDRAKEIIDDYLLFANSAPERNEKMNISEEIHHVTHIMTPLANMNGVAIDFTFDEEGKFFVMGERRKLQQCLINLFKNSIEAMQNGGTLTIKVGKEGGAVIVDIIDTGCGMTQEQINRLGEPYFTTKEKGTGLGTMVSFSIIHYMKGKVSVSSVKGKETCFSIQFPLCE
ncbi:ATP-binding protein [Priestia aryabhattai]